jgi:hypothetical protein
MDTKGQPFCRFLLRGSAAARDLACSQCFTKARGVENRPSAKMRGTTKSLHLENHTKSQ